MPVAAAKNICGKATQVDARDRALPHLASSSAVAHSMEPTSKRPARINNARSLSLAMGESRVPSAPQTGLSAYHGPFRGIVSDDAYIRTTSMQYSIERVRELPMVIDPCLRPGQARRLRFVRGIEDAKNA